MRVRRRPMAAPTLGDFIMILALDVGNTDTVIGLFDTNNLIASWRCSTEKQKSSDELGVLLSQFLAAKKVTFDNIDDVIISSVVPPIMHSLVNAIKNYAGLEPMIVSHELKIGINIKYENPNEVGADRLVNAAAVYKKYGGPAIIVDFGTATTFCVIDEKGDYLGGVITAGIKISMDALFERCAKLPRIELRRPERVIGKTTVSSMQSGAVYGYTGQADYIVRKIKEELGVKTCAVVATGGLASLIAPQSDSITIVDKMLTLDGLKLIYDLNKKQL